MKLSGALGYHFLHWKLQSPGLTVTEIAISRSRRDLIKMMKILIFQGFRTGDFPHEKGLRMCGI